MRVHVLEKICDFVTYEYTQAHRGTHEDKDKHVYKFVPNVCM